MKEIILKTEHKIQKLPPPPPSHVNKVLDIHNSISYIYKLAQIIESIHFPLAVHITVGQTYSVNLFTKIYHRIYKTQ